MSWKRGLGAGLIFVGILIIAAARVITGAVVGTRPENFLGFLGLFVLVFGIVLVLVTESLEKKVAVEEEGTHEKAHNVAEHKKLKNRYRFTESHGVPPEDKRAWITVYHGCPRGASRDFSKGLDEKKAPDGFYFTLSKRETYEALESMGISPDSAEVIPVKISRTVYGPNDKTGIVRRAANPEVDNYFKIPVERYKQVNKLIKKGLIKIEKRTR